MGYRSITIEQAKEMIDGGNVILVDIRDEVSFNEGHIAGSIRIDQRNLQEFLNSADKQKTLLCYCYHGNSSREAAHFFLKNGFNEACNMEGGFDAWRSIFPYHADGQ